MSNPPTLVDIGVNLGHDSFDHDRDAVLAAAQAAGVTRMIVTGTSVDASNKAADLAGEHPGLLFSTAGVHPHDAATFGIDTSAQLHRILQQPQVVAVGETGLDFFRDLSPRHLQEQAFAEQLELAVQTYARFRPAGRLRRQVPFHVAAALVRMCCSLVELWPEQVYLVPGLARAARRELDGNP